MDRIPRMTAFVTVAAVVFHCCLPAVAAPQTTIEGTVVIPCDPSRVREVASVRLQPVSGGPVETLAVDSSSGTFVSPALTEGEYELMALGADGSPLTPEPKRLLVQSGSNEIILSIRPPGCGEQDTDGDGAPDAADFCPDTPPGTVVGIDGCPVQAEDGGLANWQITLIYVGVVAGVILVLDDDVEGVSSPF